jgi:hypothetical protein
MNWVRVALFLEAPAAELVRDQMLQEGLRARIHREPAVAWLWFVSHRQTGLRLEVPVHDQDSTRLLFRQWDAPEGPLRLAVRCPECHSFRVDFPQFTNKSLLTNLAVGVTCGLGLLENFYCEECHCMWRKPSVKTPRTRGHMAPNYFLRDVD